MHNSKLRDTLLSPWFALIIIALAAFVIYSNVYQSPFVFDANHSIVKSQVIRDVSNFLDLKRIPTLRPVVDLTFALNYKFGKLDVFGYHLVNILIHIINGFIAYFLALIILRLLFLPSGAEEEAERSKVKGKREEGKDQRKRRKGESRGQKAGIQSRRSEEEGKAKKKKGKRKKRGSESLKLKAQTSKRETDSYQNSKLKTQNSKLPIMALFAALIFIVHPIQTQAVTYIVQRYTSLAALFYMASVLFYLKARVLTQNSKLKTQNSKLPSFNLQSSAFYILCIICGLLAFLSKQNTVSLPVAILFVEYLCVDRSWQAWKKKLPWIGLAFILCMIIVIYTSGVFRGGVNAREFLEDVSKLARETGLVSRWSYLCTQFNVLVIYIRLLFLPINQNLDYTYRFNTSFFNGFTPLAFAFLSGLVILAIWKRKRYPIATVAIFWFFITLSVESSIIPISDALFEHRLYLPMFGFALFAAWLPFRLLPKRHITAVLICMSIVISLGTSTYLRNRIWQDEMTLWTDVLAKSPQNTRACMSVGNAFASEGHYDEAIQYHSHVLKLRPEVAIANFNMGVALDKRGDKDEAIRYYMKTLRIDPRYANAHYNIGNILNDRGDFDKAVFHYSEELRINPGNDRAQINIGIALSRRGDAEDTLAHFSEAVRINPEDAEGHYNLGSALEMKGDLEGAARRYSKALVIRPGDVKAYTNLSKVLMRAGDPTLAAHCYREVLQSDTENTNVLINLGITLSQLGDLKGAVAHFSKAVRINPEDARAHYNLGLALFKKGEIDKAAEQYSESIRISPQNPNAHYSLALILHGLGDFPGAINHFEETIRLGPSLKAQAAYNIARAYARMGKIEESVGWLKKTVDAGFNNWNRLKKDTDLKNIRDTLYYISIIRDQRQGSGGRRQKSGG